MSIDLSVIIPVFNEAENLELLLPELIAELEDSGVSFEVLIVDDCSTDRTPDVIRSFVAQDHRSRGFRLFFNTKKSGALAAGFREARGDILVTIDGDMQDIPKNIPLLLQEIHSGADVVIGWKCRRQDSWRKRQASHLFNAACSLLYRVRLHDINSGLKAYKKAAVADIPLYGSLYRYGILFLHAKGWRIKEVSVPHRKRAFGRTKYDFFHRCRGISDFFSVACILRPSFSAKFRLSAHVVTANAFLAAFLVSAGIVFFQAGHTLLAGVMFVLACIVGVMTVLLGMIGLLVSRILRRHGTEMESLVAYSELGAVIAS